MGLRNGFTLGEWTVHPLEGRVSAGDVDRRVQPKSMDVLLKLAESPLQVVERDTILHEIWAEAGLRVLRKLGEGHPAPDAKFLA